MLDDESKALLRRPVQSMVVRTDEASTPTSGHLTGSDAIDPGRRARTLSPKHELLATLLGVGPGDRVLDVGCRANDDIRALSRIVGPAGSVYGLVPSGLSYVERPPGSNRRLFAGEPETLPFPHHRFDACLAVQVLEDLPSPSRAIDEMVRVGVRGSRIVVSELDWRTLVIGDEDPSAATALSDGCSARLMSPHVGGSLVSMFVDRGMRDVVAVPITTCFRRLPQAEECLGLLEGLSVACAQGRLDPVGAHALSRRLEAADAAGAFFASITGFVVAGTTR